MKKILLILPTLLLTGCTSDLSIGPIEFLEGTMIVFGVGFLMSAALQGLGITNSYPEAGQTALGSALFGLWMLAVAAEALINGLSETAELILVLLGLFFVMGSVFEMLRAKKRARKRPE